MKKWIIIIILIIISACTKMEEKEVRNNPLDSNAENTEDSNDPEPISTPVNIIFQDNFNRADNLIIGNGWIDELPSSSVKILNNYLYLMDTGFGSEIKISHTNQAGTYSYIRFKMIPRAKNCFIYIIFGNTTQYKFGVIFHDTSNIINYNASGTVIQSYSDDTTYIVEFKNINYTDSKFDIYINGYYKGNYAFWYATTSINTISIITLYDEGGWGNFDDIIIAESYQ